MYLAFMKMEDGFQTGNFPSYNYGTRLPSHEDRTSLDGLALQPLPSAFLCMALLDFVTNYQ